jgi:hypothetical protein
MANKGPKTYAIRFLFQTSSGAAQRIVETMDDEGHSLGSWWLLGELSERVVREILGQAQLALAKKYRREQGDHLVFPDGSEVDDWGWAQINVAKIYIDPMGLMGPDHSIDMTLKFPPESRWK